MASVRDDLESSSTSSIPDKERLDAEKGAVKDNVAVTEFDDPNLDDKEALEFAVANTDDFDMPSSTIRTWVMGIIWAVIIPGMNQFFFFRYPSVNVGSYVALLLSFPVGRFWARFMPKVKILGVSLNPGPFTIKEHVLITIMAGVGAGSAYATDIVAVQRVYYSQEYNFIYQWMVVMSTQLIGFSIGGILRRFLVQPASMIWPTNLQQYSGIGNRGGISRERFFGFVFLGSFCWYWFPDYIFQAMSYFNWVCWIVPNNVVVNQLFGYSSGLGMSLLTFDWAQISYIGSPLATPWGSYDRYGNSYNVTAITNPDASLNMGKYASYSPLFLSTTFAMTYGLSFASITSIITHTFLYFRKQIWVQSRRAMSDQPDIHSRLMSRYRQVPNGGHTAIMFVFGIVSIEVWHTEFPVWAFVLSLVIAFVYCIPVGMIQAITNQQLGLNVITELIIGYALPGRPIAMMMFKTWGYITMAQALTFTSDFKLGHYMKINPREMFWAQVVATVIAGTVQLAVQAWMFTNIPDICSPSQANGFICPSTEVFGTASIIWGVIGPARQFSQGQIYYGLVWFFLVGAVCPLVAYLVALKWPNSFVKYVNFPVIFSGTGAIPPATAINYVPWAIVGFIFNYIIRRRHFSWWTKYNYVLSAGLDSGVAISIIVIFFCVQYPLAGAIGKNTIQAWWGNTVPFDNADGRSASYKVLAEGGHFG
ncbi:OPT oligopeptide transporter [Fomitopsis serialis]|uniref:OPT oligopeptide transporter n=1 Tax=Fomitopsis serialis TaxID=139415 RepID=UPI002007A87C|nr:OPT oligopeptide transporter [Neoantrodia serialis]KAH9911843.1 OPT oligopeptide transporter [Neoantrodia serialis]